MGLRFGVQRRRRIEVIQFNTAEPPRPPMRLSFRASLRLIRGGLPDFQRTDGRNHPIIYQDLLTEIVAATLPPRANRLDPRAIKQKISNFQVKGRQHYGWSQPTRPFQEAIVQLI